MMKLWNPFSLCVAAVVALVILQTAAATTSTRKFVQNLNFDDGMLEVLSDGVKTNWQPVEEVEEEVGGSPVMNSK